MRYQTKPRPVDAIRFDSAKYEQVEKWLQGHGINPTAGGNIPRPLKKATNGQWLVRFEDTGGYAVITNEEFQEAIQAVGD